MAWDEEMAAASGQPMPDLSGFVPPNLKVRPASAQPLPTFTAPTRTAAQGFREGFDDFGQRAAGAALLDFDDEIAGAAAAASGGSYKETRDKRRKQKSDAEERSPGAAMAGDLFGGGILPGGAAAQLIQGGVSTVGAAESLAGRHIVRNLVENAVASTILHKGLSVPREAARVVSEIHAPPSLGLSGSAATVRPTALAARSKPAAKSWEDAVREETERARAHDRLKRDVKKGLAPSGVSDPGTFVPEDLPAYPAHLEGTTDPTNHGLRRHYDPPNKVAAGAAEPVKPVSTPDELEAWKQDNIKRQKGYKPASGPGWGKFGLPERFEPPPTLIEAIEKELGPNWREVMDEVSRR